MSLSREIEKLAHDFQFENLKSTYEDIQLESNMFLENYYDFCLMDRDLNRLIEGYDIEEFAKIFKEYSQIYNDMKSDNIQKLTSLLQNFLDDVKTLDKEMSIKFKKQKQIYEGI
jgi:hypothetical protein